MKTFIKYAEIDNSYKGDAVRAIQSSIAYSGYTGDFVCTNKVDGTNFQISIDENGEIKIGSRTQYVDGTFFNVQKVLDRDNIFDKVKKLKTKVADLFKMKEDEFALIVFGELCGGAYPNQKSDPGTTKIQGRINYCPNNEWIVFDAKIVINPDDLENRITKYINIDKLNEFCEEVNLYHQIIVFRGTFEECLDFNVYYPDPTGNDLYGFTILENNITEGVVIKPVDAIFKANGDRCILKKKNTKFSERITGNSEVGKHRGSFTEDEEKYYKIMLEYITESRFYSALSKLGHPISSGNDFGPMIGLFSKDLVNDFEKDYAEELEKFKDDELFDMKKIRKCINKDTQDFVRVLFVKELNK